MMWSWIVAAGVVLALIANLLLAPQQPMWAILFGLFLVGALLLSPERNFGLLFARSPRSWWVVGAIYLVLVATMPGSLLERARLVGIACAQALFGFALAYRIFFAKRGQTGRPNETFHESDKD